MSHTGSVVRPDKSPGLIRMVTLGHVLEKANRQLTFVIPDPPPNEEATIDDWEESAQNRFVIFLNQTGQAFHYGDGVRLNLETYDDGGERNGDGIPKKWEGLIGPEDLTSLKEAIPEPWCSKVGSKFEFSFVATEVKPLPPKFILNPLFHFVEDLAADSTSLILQALRQAAIGRVIKFQRPIAVGFHINVRSGGRVTAELRKAEYRVNQIRFLSQGGGIPTIADCLDHKYKSWSEILQEIGDNGQHFIATPEELPTREGRYE